MSTSRFEDFGSDSFTFEEEGKRKDKTVKGKHWELSYAYRKMDRTFSKLEIIENYKQAALERGGRILKEDDTKLQFKMLLLSLMIALAGDQQAGADVALLPFIPGVACMNLNRAR